MKLVVEIRLPYPVRALAVAVLVLISVSLARTGLKFPNFIAAALVFCWVVYVLSYRVRMDAVVVRVRYAPFVERSFRVDSIRYVKEGNPITLSTGTTALHLWGLSSSKRAEVDGLLPKHIPRRSLKDKDPEVGASQHGRRAKLAAVLLVLSIAAVLPFTRGRVWYPYWISIGRNIVLVIEALFLWLVFEVGMWWVHRRYIHETRGHAEKK